MMKEIICVICPKSCRIQASQDNGIWEVKGNGCKRGAEFAVSEAVNPKRSLTTTMRTVFDELPLLPVKTDKDIPLEKLFEVMKEINKATVDHEVRIGEVLIENILGTGANIVSTSYIHG